MRFVMNFTTAADLGERAEEDEPSGRRHDAVQWSPALRVRSAEEPRQKIRVNAPTGESGHLEQDAEGGETGRHAE